MKKIFIILSILALSLLSFAQFPSSFTVIHESPKTDFESFMQGVKEYSLGKIIYNGNDCSNVGAFMRDNNYTKIGYCYVLNELGKFMEAALPNANMGFDYYNNGSMQHLEIDMSITANWYWGRNYNMYWDIQCSLNFHPYMRSDINYSYRLPKVTVMSSDAANNTDHSLYNVMLGNITRHILYHSYSKELNLKKIKTGWNEGTLRNSYSSGLENICEGIYEDIANNDNKYKLGVKHIDGKLYIIYLGGALWKKDWSEGELKAILEYTATPNFYKAEWIGAMKNKMQGYVTFEQGIMKTVINGETTTYLKLYPATSDIATNSQTESWSGSGFALNNGYIITNYHVIEDAKSIVVKGVKGNFSEAYQVEIVASDKYNDLTLLKINDSRFTGFGTIPYKVKTTTSEVGEDVFVLGYPMRSTMGDEIKLTTGVISSKTGFQGDVSLYQISAPVQPGNSGGPLFDGKGNLIGIVNAKHNGAENVGYAIKTSYLKNLIETVCSSATILPQNNSISELSLTSKVKSVKNFVFMIECSSKSNAKSFAKSTSESNFSSPVESNAIGGKELKTYYPYTSSNISDLFITCVKVTDSYTAIEIKSHFSNYAYCSIKADTYILVNGKQMKLVRTEGINIHPQVTYYNYKDITFTLYFPPIPDTTTSIDLIEPESTWKIYDIKLRK